MTFLSDAEIILNSLEAYHQLSISRQGPVLEQKSSARLVADLELEKLVKTGGLAGENLAGFIPQIPGSDQPSAPPAYLAHQVAVPHPAGSLALDDRRLYQQRHGNLRDGAGRIEHRVLRAQLAAGKSRLAAGAVCRAAFPEAGQVHGGGVLTHGGSLGQPDRV